jgi:hypothetical protein
MCNPTRTFPNQIFHLKGFFMDSFTLGLNPKIDFTRTLEHTLAPAWELADLQFSLNTLSKHYGIFCQILYKTLAKSPLFIASRDLKNSWDSDSGWRVSRWKLATSRRFSAIYFRNGCYSLSIQTVGRPDVSIGRPAIEVACFFSYLSNNTNFVSIRYSSRELW